MSSVKRFRVRQGLFWFCEKDKNLWNNSQLLVTENWFYPLNTKINLNYVWRLSSYRAVNTLHLCYKNQSVNAVQWNNRCLFSDPHKTHKYVHCVGRTYRAVNTFRLGMCVQWNNRCLFSDPHKTHKYSVWAELTAQKTHAVSVIEASQLLLYSEIIPVYSEIHTKHKYTVWAERTAQ
jgi:hypothetical protein